MFPETFLVKYTSCKSFWTTLISALALFTVHSASGHHCAKKNQYDCNSVARQSATPLGNGGYVRNQTFSGYHVKRYNSTRMLPATGANSAAFTSFWSNFVETNSTEQPPKPRNSAAGSSQFLCCGEFSGGGWGWLLYGLSKTSVRCTAFHSLSHKHPAPSCHRLYN